jgi:hypothetical protein
VVISPPASLRTSPSACLFPTARFHGEAGWSTSHFLLWMDIKLQWTREGEFFAWFCSASHTKLTNYFCVAWCTSCRRQPRPSRVRCTSWQPPRLLVQILIRWEGGRNKGEFILFLCTPTSLIIVNICLILGTSTMYLNRGKPLNSELFYFIDLLINISFVSPPFAITTQSTWGVDEDSSVPPLIGGMIVIGCILFIPPVKE